MQLKDFLSREADRCVKCGACLPFCPTYQLSRNESESPRGRIALIQALAEDKIDSQNAQKHLDHCLTCLACEGVCPSSVKYGELIDGYRQMKAPNNQPESLRQLNLLSQLPYKALSFPLYWCYRNLGVRPLFRWILGKKFRRLDSMLPKKAGPGSLTTTNTPKPGSSSVRVGIFTGCISKYSDRLALHATLEVLNWLGVEYVIPDNQGCCGAMHAHGGYPEEAEQMSAVNREAFDNQGLDAIIYVASGCGAQLTQITTHSLPVLEICQFLNQHPWPEHCTLQTYSGRVVRHTPCTLKNHLNLDNETEQLLGKIPELGIEQIKHTHCCGAAGSLLVQQPDLTDKLREPIIDELESSPPSILLTSNTGCAMHLRSGITQAGIPTRLMHPIELIAQQIVN